jgi:hypothetical protein
MLKALVLVSFCFTPFENNPLRIFAIESEFLLSASFAVLLVVSIPRVREALSGFTIATAVAGTEIKVLLVLLLQLWAKGVVKIREDLFCCE